MSKNNKTSVRFSSEKNANDFASKVGGEVKDLRNNSHAKSKFKVDYIAKQNKHSNYAHDFDSDININGMHWHTSEDL